MIGNDITSTFSMSWIQIMGKCSIDSIDMYDGDSEVTKPVPPYHYCGLSVSDCKYCN